MATERSTGRGLRLLTGRKRFAAIVVASVAIDWGSDRMKRRLGDRRVRPRFEIVGDLWGTLDTVVGMPLLNVGVGGALVQSAVPLTPQSVHHVAVSCDGQQTPTSVQVRHVRPVAGTDGRDFYLIGLEFLTMPAALVTQIQTWMNGNGQHVAEGV